MTMSHLLRFITHPLYPSVEPFLGVVTPRRDLILCLQSARQKLGPPLVPICIEAAFEIQVFNAPIESEVHAVYKIFKIHKISGIEKALDVDGELGIWQAHLAVLNVFWPARYVTCLSGHEDEEQSQLPEFETGKQMLHPLGPRECGGAERFEVLGLRAEKLSCSFYLVGRDAHNPLLYLDVNHLIRRKDR